jgi:hypothetical protein
MPDGYEEVHPLVSMVDSAEPIIGETTQGLGEYLIRTGILNDQDAYQRIRRDALAIVQRSLPFSGADQTRTGLVVGYVQSGKTMSMTAVSALARDNGCRIIVLLAGVTTNLLQQNAERFRTHLRGASGRAAAWRIANSQNGLGDTDLQHLQQAVNEWRDPSFPQGDRQTFLYMVLKNHAHLDRLHALLSQVNLRGIPALIIDDEADQAGLNTRPNEPEASTTYSRIVALRSVLPHHTYLQYTATPQAPLLIALDDMLSPAFAELVEPGANYTGGTVFFGPNSPVGLVRSIPKEDLFKPGEPPESPPDSLLEAMRTFFVGSVVAAIRGGRSPRSMLVHPSQRRSDHGRYLGWIGEIIKRWTNTLRSGDEAERRDTIEEFRNAYVDLSTTDKELPPFESMIQRIQVSMGRVSLTEVNSAEGSEIDWNNADEHILVGGEKLNRGFTVEGLTVTYMPRGTGDWNADTIQQRARFFGYKAKYLSLCRLYLHADVVGAYRSYVRHEEDIRKQLAEHRGKPLREWRRAFFLDQKMRPTRRNVLSDPYYRIPADRLWFIQRYPHADLGTIARNTELLREALKGHNLVKEGDYFEHWTALGSLKEFYRDALVTYEVGGPDMPSWYGQLVTLGDVLEENPDAEVLLMKMGGDRQRTPASGAIALHQGRSSAKAGGYPGDNKMFDPNLVTIQIHSINVSDGPSDVPALAVYIPASLRRDDVGVLLS